MIFLKTKLSVGGLAVCFLVIANGASPLDDWEVIEPWPPVGGITRVFTDGVRFIAVSSTKLVYSPDGTNWDHTYPNTAYNELEYASCAFGNGQFVANYKNKVWISSTGTNWTSITLPNNGNGVAYANGQYVIGGEMGIWISQDASNWSKVDVYRVYSASTPMFFDGKWHIISDRSELCSSTNCISWSYNKLPTLTFPTTTQIVAGNGVYVLGGDNIIYASSNLTNWIRIDGLPQLQVAFGGKYFVGVNGFSGGGLFVSTDGLNWIKKLDILFYSKPVFGNHRFIVAGGNAFHVSSSLPENPDHQLSIERFAGV